MKKILLSLLCALTPLSLHAESIESKINQQVKQMLPYSYQHRANIFQSHSIKTNVKEDYILPWFENDKPNEERANIILNSVSKEPKLSIEKDTSGNNNLSLSKRFEVYPSFTYIGNIEAQIINSASPEIKQKKLPAKITLEHDLKKNLFANFELILKALPKRIDLLEGSIDINLIAETGYNNARITPEDIGKVFTLDGVKHEIIDIMDKTIIIKVEKNKESLDYKLINLDENKGLIFPKEPKEQSNYEEYKTQYVYKKEYELFKSNIQLSEAEYSSKLKESFETASLESQEKSGSTELILNKPFTSISKEIFNKHLGEQYLVIKFLAPSKHNYLYVSKTIEKKITATYKE